MQAQKIDYSDTRRGLAFDTTSGAMLLVGSESTFSSGTNQRIFCQKQFRIAGVATTLLEALARIQSAAIDLVLLSCEFCEAELALFAFDARRRGFEGLILHLPTPYSPAFGGKVGKTQSDFTSQSETFPSKLQATETVGTTFRSASRQLLTMPPGLVVLTAKQQSVLSGVADGRSNLEIANGLKCSEGSVKASIQELFQKFQVRKRAHLVRLALENRFVDTTPLRGHTESAESTALATSSEHVAIHQLPEQHREWNTACQSLIRLGDFIVDVSNSRVWVRGDEVSLTPLEYKLLAIFARHPEQTLGHKQLASEIWNDAQSGPEPVRVLISALRKKVEITSQQPTYIRTQARFGYRFVPSAPEPSGTDAQALPVPRAAV
jgi:DNA-binding response OmpR family regulator